MGTLSGERHAGGITKPWSSELTYRYLERLLEITRTRFELRPLRDGAGSEGDPPRAILRHDVDVCLRRAVDLAEREAQWGIAGTYLVQVDCPLYRIDDSEGRESLKRLADLGHEVGLHVDVGPAQLDADAAAIEPRVQAGHKLLMDVTGAPVASVSFHRPAPALLRGPNSIVGLVNAYGTDLMTTYLSDSEGRWRHGEPVAQVRATAGRFLQLLVHPIWWGERHLSAGDRLQEFFEASILGMEPGAVHTFDAELLRAVGPARRSGLR